MTGCDPCVSPEKCLDGYCSLADSIGSYNVAIAAMRDRLTSDPEARKNAPMARGLLDYFPLALAEVAALSLAATQQHHPDKPMHWDRDKSKDHADCIVRHLVDRGRTDKDGQRHSAKVAWRALALLQIELEQAGEAVFHRPVDRMQAGGE